MILVIFLVVALFFSFSFYKKRKQEKARILALARQERIKKIRAFCLRAHENPAGESVIGLQLWWARNHEQDPELVQYYY